MSNFIQPFHWGFFALIDSIILAWFRDQRDNSRKQVHFYNLQRRFNNFDEFFNVDLILWAKINCDSGMDK